MSMRVISGRQEEINKNIFEQALKLRYEIYREMGFLSENKEGKDYDEYDKEAVHIIALDGNRVIGYLRLIKEMPLLSLYGEEVMYIKEKENLKNPIELSRFVILLKYRIGNKEIIDYEKFVSFLLFKKAYEYIFSQKIDSVFIVTNPIYVERYEKFYFFKRYGKEKEYKTFFNNPAILLYQNISEAIKEARNKDKKFYKFMTKY